MEETTQTPAKKTRSRKPEASAAKKKSVKKETKKRGPKKKIENNFLARLKEIHGKLNYHDLALAFLVLDAAVRLIG
ncbi:hypothetical protein [Leptospira johnsonii]|uniref:Penicillin-binding protein 1B n=1 Tax=Leptospira johnsonii TaxID=1917820 RepID=A0A2P2D7U5_9LEPT|nr:hypothetical protein [Leptospira johnsonii]GBF40705.1 penicillin-binding protein 1B [Leptospira johnsonii]